ncbi:RNA-directed DNA polymerase from mobile element jockey [Caerostris darwini]|uniref:RNA-directed DNA polymerase from mobile element jockey n=1 Tax=Caerostris darwini TaxID=1538125 RepID=A0AAV4RMW7_9ARAC|nr:RNA-directed DNA polymerase from mobile element jockey [Caerostris darwini]
MKTTYHSLHAAPVVAQLKKDRGPGLGRGPCSKNVLQSPKSLKILQLNINGNATNASRVKLDQVLELAHSHGVQIIALQETKLSNSTSLKIKGYSILRTDRQRGNGGGLIYLIRDVGYESISISGRITGNSSLKIQGIRVTWRGKPLNILNMYHPPDATGLPNNLANLLIGSTICIGDLNAKHTVWGCSSDNKRGCDLLNLIDDKGFLFLNDVTPTHSSFSYNTREALDVSFVSPDNSPSCNWSVLDNIGSDHLPVLIEFNKRQSVAYSYKNDGILGVRIGNYLILSLSKKLKRNLLQAM